MSANLFMIRFSLHFSFSRVRRWWRRWRLRHHSGRQVDTHRWKRRHHHRWHTGKLRWHAGRKSVWRRWKVWRWPNESHHRISGWHHHRWHTYHTHKRDQEFSFAGTIFTRFLLTKRGWHRKSWRKCTRLYFARFERSRCWILKKI